MRQQNDAAPKPLTLIYIMGDGRSGSTILSIILGNHSAIESVGELSRWPVFKGYPKSGNEKPEDHIFWNTVRQVYFEEGSQPEFSQLVDIQSRVEDYRYFFNVVFNRLPLHIKSGYCAHLKRLLNAICAASKKQILVDSSKNMGRAWMMLQSGDYNVRIIHFVRDSRGALWSNMKRNVEQEYKSPVKALLHYSIKNSLSWLVQCLAPKGAVLRVRYENLVTQPAKEFKRIGQFLNQSMDVLVDQLSEGQSLRVPHLIDGNRIRNEISITLTADNEWRKRLSVGYRWLAVSLTWPFILAYGYWRQNNGQ